MTKIIKHTDLTTEQPGPRADVLLPPEFELWLLMQRGVPEDLEGDDDDSTLDYLEGLEPF